MEANTLRIGNLIYDDHKIISKVTGFAPFDHSTRCDELEGCEILIDLYLNDGTIRKGMQVDSNLTSPIPLSDEWFLKFDFELRYFNNDKKRPLWWLVIDNRHIDIYPNGDKGFYILINSLQMSIPIIHVHQIQNLVFSLTGEELTIKD